MVDITQFETVGGLAVVVFLLVQAAKPLLTARLIPWLPWLSIVMGIILAVLVAVGTGETTRLQLVTFFFTGILAGLSAVGLYQGTVQLANDQGKDATATPPAPPSAQG